LVSSNLQLALIERQKAARKINQLKRELENGRSSEEKTLSKKELKALEKALFEARVDLNYILVGILAHLYHLYSP
jgi:hypothetical protein